MSSILKKADKLNLSLSLVSYINWVYIVYADALVQSLAKGYQQSQFLLNYAVCNISFSFKGYDELRMGNRCIIIYNQLDADIYPIYIFYTYL